MKQMLAVLLVVALAGLLANGPAHGQKVGSTMTFFPTQFQLESGFSVCPEKGRFLLVAGSVKGKVRYNLWSYHSTFEDAEYLHKRLMEGYKLGGSITAIEARVLIVKSVAPSPGAKYSQIVTVLITKIYVKPKV